MKTNCWFVSALAALSLVTATFADGPAPTAKPEVTIESVTPERAKADKAYHDAFTKADVEGMQAAIADLRAQQTAAAAVPAGVAYGAPIYTYQPGAPVYEFNPQLTFNPTIVVDKDDGSVGVTPTATTTTPQQQVVVVPGAGTTGQPGQNGVNGQNGAPAAAAPGPG